MEKSLYDAGFIGQSALSHDQYRIRILCDNLGEEGRKDVIRERKSAVSEVLF